MIGGVCGIIFGCGLAILFPDFPELIYPIVGSALALGGLVLQEIVWD